MSVRSGLEVLLSDRRQLATDRIGLICHPASVDSKLRHAADLLRSAFRLTALFGPQHGARGETQDNMIEWQDYRDPRTGLPVYSLYGETRQPQDHMLAEVDTLVFDLQDVGARYYTFIWTMALAMQACARLGKRFVVLDRPNPIGGAHLEGNLPDPRFASFVGLYPLAVRHGMTAGEVALYLNGEFELGCELDVIAMQGWQRQMDFQATALPWVLPSPNIPSADTALVYPGLCLLEGTNASEGRGTTRPFEISGAPWVDPDRLADRLQDFQLPGARFRPLHFIPAFHKWSGKMIGGVQIHVVDRLSFRPFRTGLALLRAYRELGGQEFQWKEPPYEYEREKLPIDILCGSDAIRHQIESGVGLEEMEACWADDLEGFGKLREKYLLY
ncbi:MAG: DUF1343 domain-containing protein [Acidobacteriota bacterium]